jgi:hypothetical protein
VTATSTIASAASDIATGNIPVQRLICARVILASMARFYPRAGDRSCGDTVEM